MATTTEFLERARERLGTAQRYLRNGVFDGVLAHLGAAEDLVENAISAYGLEPVCLRNARGAVEAAIWEVQRPPHPPAGRGPLERRAALDAALVSVEQAIEELSASESESMGANCRNARTAEPPLVPTEKSVH